MEWIKWVFEPPPTPLVWVASVVAIIAFVGWLVNEILQIICRPKLRVCFRGLNHTIWCQIQNMPIGNGYLIQRRTVQDLTVRIAIIDMNIDDPLLNLIHWDKTARKIRFGYDTVEKRRHIMLPASKLGADIEIARASELKSLAFDENDELKIELHEGRYKAEMTIYADGKEIEVGRDFRINRNEPFIEWIHNGEIYL